MNPLYPTILAVFSVLTPIKAQIRSNGKPTEKVVIRYEKLVASGAFLTPAGWKRAAKLYEQAPPFSPRDEISLMGTGGSVGEYWVRGDKAEVQTKWTDYFGTIDSALRYEPLKTDTHLTMAFYVFHLLYTNKHRDLGPNGETIREVIGPTEWKIEEPLMARWTTIPQALEYVTRMRESTDDPLIRKNADRTIAILKHLGAGCGTASAC